MTASLGTVSGKTLNINPGKAATRFSTAVSGRSALGSLAVAALSTLKTYTDWLAAHSASGYVGEVGWPYSTDNTYWQVLGELFYQRCDTAGLPITYWATGEPWSQTYINLAYNGVPVSNALAPASVIEAHLGSAVLRGINVAGGEFTQSGFAAGTPGTFNTDYWYSTQSTYTYLASRGITLVRIPFRWERLQPTLGAALDATELGRLQTAVGYAANAGLKVVLDCHNYGKYTLAGPTVATLGSASVTQAHFVDFWTRMSTAFKNTAAVEMYALMNEPSGLVGTPSYTTRATLNTFASTVENWGTTNGGTWDASHGGALRYQPAASSTDVEADNSLRDRSANGTTFWADVFIESGAAGNWDVALQSQDASFGFLRDPTTPYVRLVKGQTNRLRLNLTQAQAASMRNLQINWGGSGRNGTDYAYVEFVAQGDYSGPTPTQIWEAASAAAAAAIRANGDSKTVSVAPYVVAAETTWGTTHPVPWVPQTNVRYEHHQYFDYPAGGTYPDSYATDLAAAGG